MRWQMRALPAYYRGRRPTRISHTGLVIESFWDEHRAAVVRVDAYNLSESWRITGAAGLAPRAVVSRRPRTRSDRASRCHCDLDPADADRRAAWRQRPDVLGAATDLATPRSAVLSAAEIPPAAPIARPVHWVASPGGSASINSTTRSITAAGISGNPGSRVLIVQ